MSVLPPPVLGIHHIVTTEETPLDERLFHQTLSMLAT